MAAQPVPGARRYQPTAHAQGPELAPHPAGIPGRSCLGVQQQRPAKDYTFATSPSSTVTTPRSSSAAAEAKGRGPPA